MDILIIDDDNVDRMLFKNFIKDADPSINVIEAENGKDGLQKIEDGAYDCIFLDFLLPDTDGISLLKQIHNPATDLGPCPIVLLTGQGQESIFTQAIKFGAQDYLIKNNLFSNNIMPVIEKARRVYNIKQSQNETKVKLNQSLKIEALGKLTGGIAHDFNNMLTIILGNIRLLKDDIQDENIDKEVHLKKLETIQKTAQRGADLVQHLMVFSHQRDLKPEPTNINILIHEAQDLLERTIGQAVKIHLNFDDNLWLTDIDQSQLEHMIINITANARDAMPDGGQLDIKTENIEIDSAKAEKLQISEGPYVLLSITDNGTGIPEDIKEKVFDPFFTTKKAGKGTGLGMSIAYGFVRDCHGTINIISKADEGTTFEIYFPKSDQELIVEKDDSTKPLPQGNSETVLVVEDEEEIKEIAVQILEKNGYKTLQASNADDALTILTKSKQHIDLLFTDVVMPGEINGAQLALRALDMRPNLNILFTTGFLKTSIPDKKLFNEHALLDKPYRPSTLLREVKKAINQD